MERLFHFWHKWETTHKDYTLPCNISFDSVNIVGPESRAMHERICQVAMYGATHIYQVCIICGKVRGTTVVGQH